MNNIPEFGIKRENEERRDGGCAVVFDPENQKYAVYRNLKNQMLGLYGGGFDEGEDEEEGALRELTEESGLYDFLYIEKVEKVLTHYFNFNKKKNRVALATCFLVILKSTKLKQTKLEEHEKFELEWVNPEELFSIWKSHSENKNYDHWIYFLEKAVNRAIELGYDKTSSKI
ncbi:MAG: NUDIX hydrolase [Candidatus Paceibacterota bacterium]